MGFILKAVDTIFASAGTLPLLLRYFKVSIVPYNLIFFLKNSKEDIILSQEYFLITALAAAMAINPVPIVPDKESNISILFPAFKKSRAIFADFITADNLELICIEIIFL